MREQNVSGGCGGTAGANRTKIPALESAKQLLSNGIYHVAVHAVVLEVSLQLRNQSFADYVASSAAFRTKLDALERAY